MISFLGQIRGLVRDSKTDIDITPAETQQCVLNVVAGKAKIAACHSTTHNNEIHKIRKKT